MYQAAVHVLHLLSPCLPYGSYRHAPPRSPLVRASPATPISWLTWSPLAPATPWCAGGLKAGLARPAAARPRARLGGAADQAA